MVILGVLYGREETVDEEKVERAFLVLVFVTLLPSAISFYFFYHIIFPIYFRNKKFIKTFIYGSSIAVLSACLGYFILTNLFADSCNETTSTADFIGILLFMTLIAEISGVIALLMQGFITWFEELKLREALAAKNHEIELTLVKSQLDPHFLFNTINNIDVLILKDADKASSYLNKLSDIMRFMLYETKGDEILLSRELEYIEKYIELQRIRTSNKNYIQLKVFGTADDGLIAPMLFIPFIENAVKHTTNKKIDKAISIQIDIKKEVITFNCKNKLEQHRKSAKKEGGLGNELMQKRLKLLYKDQFDLKINKTEGQYEVILKIFDGKKKLHNH